LEGARNPANGAGELCRNPNPNPILRWILAMPASCYGGQFSHEGGIVRWVETVCSERDTNLRPWHVLTAAKDEPW